MTTNGNIEQRLATLEQEVAELKSQATAHQRQDAAWPDSVFGRMTDFPEWETICREGKQLGNAQDDSAS